jgi:universal stress protein A
MKFRKTAETAADGERGRSSTNKHANVMTESWRHQQLHIKRILVPVDFSEPSKKALQYAITLAGEFGAELSLLHVIQPYPIVPDLQTATPALNAILQKDATENLEKLVATIKGVAVQQVIRWGSPAREIAAEAEKQDADLIIINTHGRTGLAHLFIGSVAEQVVRFAKCPVLTLREREHDFMKVPVDDAELNRIGSQTASKTGGAYVR